MPKIVNKKSSARKTQPDLTDLERRLQDLERRVALLEARQAKPTLVGATPPSGQPRPAHYADSETDFVRDAEKP